MSITDVEARIARCVARGEWADFRQQPEDGRSVSGDFIRRLLTAWPLSQSDHQAIADRQQDYAPFRPSTDYAPVPVSAAGVRIRGATVEGLLDLSNCGSGAGAALPALALEDCRLLGRAGIGAHDLQDDDAMSCLDLSRASIASVSLKGSAFTRVAMVDARIDGAVDISGARPLAGWEDHEVDGSGRMAAFRRRMLAAARSLHEDGASSTSAEIPPADATAARAHREAPASVDPHSYCWLDLSNSRIQGSLLAHGVRLRVARRDRERRSDVQRPARFALRLESATVSGPLDARGGSVFDGGLSLYVADIRGEVWLGGGCLLKERGIALDAQGARLGSIFAVAAPPLRIRGTVFLNSARISGHVKLPAADIDGDGNASLMAESSTIGGDLVLNECAAIRGPVGLTSASIGGTLDLRGAMISGVTSRGHDNETAGEQCDALHARGLSVGSDAFLSDGFIADGCVRLAGARIGDDLDLRGATLAGAIPNQYQGGRAVRDPQFAPEETTVSALWGSDIAVGGSLRLGSTRPHSRVFFALGHVTLQRGSIGKDLDIINCRIAPRPSAADRQVLDLGWVTVAGTMILESNQFGGVVNFEHASTNVLADADVGAYNGASHLRLNGFKYETFYEPPGERHEPSVLDLVKARTEWLKQMPRYRSQPYANLAQVLIRHGRTDAARDILIQKYRQEREERVHRLNRGLLLERPDEFVRTSLFLAASWLLDVTFGYGLKPARATGTLVCAFFVGWVFFAMANNRGAMVVDQQPIAGYVQGDQMVALRAGDDAASGVRCGDNISPALYALDVFIPLVDLRQESRCEIGRASDARTLFNGFVLGEARVLDEIDLDQCLKALYALSGWLLISLSILTFSGVLERRDAEK